MSASIYADDALRIIIIGDIANTSQVNKLLHECVGCINRTNLALDDSLDNSGLAQHLTKQDVLPMLHGCGADTVTKILFELSETSAVRNVRVTQNMRYLGPQLEHRGKFAIERAKRAQAIRTAFFPWAVSGISNRFLSDFESLFPSLSFTKLVYQV